MAVFSKGFVDGAKKFLQVDDWKNVLSSNEAINPIKGDGMMSGIPKTIYNMRKEKMDIIEAAKKAHMKDGKANYAAIAGSYMGVSAGARVLSGGGVHRDSDGRSNIIGLPFI